MKQTTLGKILILLFLELSLFANVKISVDSPAIYKGDNISFTITAEGDDVKFPDIYEVKGNSILGTSSSSQTSIINGVVSKKISKSYTFTPQKSLTIPSFEVEVSGKKYQTKEIKISVLKPTASVNGADFMLELRVDKKEAYVGEEIKLTIVLKEKLNAKADKLQLGKPKLANFWIKKSGEVEQDREGEYIVQKLHYLLSPQKEGNYTIPAITAKIGKIVRNRRGGLFDDPFFSSFGTELRWKKIFSNELKLNIKPLPNNLELYGKFMIDATVDKKKIKTNKPVNLTIEIEGDGNIDDIKKFNFDIENAIVYADEPKIKNAKFTQKIAIISDSSYTIPSISLKYFDKNLKKVVITQTKPIDITVLGGKKIDKTPTIEVSKELDSKKTTLQKPQKIIVKNENSYLKYLFLLFGTVLGFALAMILGKFKTEKTKKELDIIKEIKKVKSDKKLFELLLPYSKDKIISNILDKLEQNIYQNSKNKIDKNELIEFFEEEI